MCLFCLQLTIETRSRNLWMNGRLNERFRMNAGNCRFSISGNWRRRLGGGYCWGRLWRMSQPNEVTEVIRQNLRRSGQDLPGAQWLVNMRSRRRRRPITLSWGYLVGICCIHKRVVKSWRQRVRATWIIRFVRMFPIRVCVYFVFINVITTQVGRWVENHSHSVRQSGGTNWANSYSQRESWWRVNLESSRYNFLPHREKQTKLTSPWHTIEYARTRNGGWGVKKMLTIWVCTVSLVGTHGG